MRTKGQIWQLKHWKRGTFIVRLLENEDSDGTWLYTQLVEGPVANMDGSPSGKVPGDPLTMNREHLSWLQLMDSDYEEHNYPERFGKGDGKP